MYTGNYIGFDIVEMAVSKEARKKRNVISVLLFIGFLGFSALGIILFQSKILSLILILPFGLTSWLVSKKAAQLQKIGTMVMDSTEIILVNEINGQKRNIPATEISKIFVRGGVKISSDVINKKTVFVDITLHTGEQVIVHVNVERLDEYTADQITTWCKTFDIVCYRKL